MRYALALACFLAACSGPSKPATVPPDPEPEPETTTPPPVEEAPPATADAKWWCVNDETIDAISCADGGLSACDEAREAYGITSPCWQATEVWCGVIDDEGNITDTCTSTETECTTFLGVVEDMGGRVVEPCAREL